jgi:sugar fermentation stimulation protein A
LKYRSVKKAKFIKRPNRFIGHVIVDDQEEIVHVKNTGRCREILLENTEVIIEESQNTKRKTKYSLIAAYKGDVLINIDSQVPNAVVYEALLKGEVKEIQNVTQLKREVVYGNSRFDLYFETKEQKGFVEVKGVTLEEEGVAMFPDAPTERGSKHILEMIKAVEEGYLGFIFFLIQMKGVRYFTPYEIRDPKLASALRLAKEKGVKILAYDSIIKEDEITIDAPIEVRL